ncbi:MAG: HEAT repeat domain-containing protein [Myxococcales bacterium]
MIELASVALSAAERQRVERVDVLTASGPSSYAALEEMLTDPSWTVRRAVIAALAALGNVAVVPLFQLLRTKRDDEARLAAAVDALVASTGDVEAEAEAFARDDEEFHVLADVAQVLGRRQRARSVPVLVRLAQHPNDNVAVTALEGLGRIGGRAAVDQLVAAVESRSLFRTFPAIDVLGRSGDPRAIEPLAALLDDPQYAFEAARALGRTGHRSAVAPLTKLLQRAGDANARLVALSLADLRERHAQLFGSEEPIDEAIRGAEERIPVGRRLVRALSGADPAEQVAISRVLGAIGGEDAVSALTQLLDAGAPVAQAATASLKRLGRASDPQLLRALGEGDSKRRELLLPIVSHAAALPEVVRCLEDSDPTVRALACEALARIGSPLAAPPLFRLLGDPNPAVVQAASGAIHSLGSAETERLAFQAARSPSPAVRRAALEILSYFGYASAVPLFLEAIRDPDSRVRDTAIQGLALLDDPRAKEALFAAASDPSERMRIAAARALSLCATDLRTTAYLLKALADPSPWVRYYACQSLGKLRAEAAAPAISALLRDPAGQVRVAAVEALSHLETPTALEALRQAASAPDADVQRAALIGLGITRRKDALPILLAGATSPEDATRLVALSAMTGFEGSEVPQALARAAEDTDENVRAAALGFLSGHPGKEATKLLIDLLPRQATKEPIVAALSLPVPGRIEGTLEALATADEEMAPILTSALARMHNEQGEQALLHAMELPATAARKAAATALAAIRSKPALAALRHAAEADADAEVRRVCALLLSQ